MPKRKPLLLALLAAGLLTGEGLTEAQAGAAATRAGSGSRKNLDLAKL